MAGICGRSAGGRAPACSLSAPTAGMRPRRPTRRSPRCGRRSRSGLATACARRASGRRSPWPRWPRRERRRCASRWSRARYARSAWRRSATSWNPCRLRRSDGGCPMTLAPRMAPSKALVGVNTPLGRIIRASHRLNPSLDLETGLVGGQADTKLGTKEQWSASVLTHVAPDAQDVLRLNKNATPTSALSDTPLSPVGRHFTNGDLTFSMPSTRVSRMLCAQFRRPHIRSLRREAVWLRHSVTPSPTAFTTAGRNQPPTYLASQCIQSSLKGRRPACNRQRSPSGH